MKSSLHKPQRLLASILTLCIVLAVSLVFGHVLGNYYLENITKNDNRIEYQPSVAPRQNVRIKVLRLKQGSYSTIQTGTFADEEAAIKLGRVLAQQGLPAVITEESSYLVLVGFLNNCDKLAILADSITIDGQKPQVIQRKLNSISFKFEVGDAYAEQYVAPFLGELSTCLQKGIMLYSDINIEEKDSIQLISGYRLLAAELEQLVSVGETVAEKGKTTDFYEGLLILIERCRAWAESINSLENNWQQLPLLISQQQALALLEDYHRFMATTN